MSKTTLYGVLGFISLLCGTVMALIDNDPETIPNWTALIERAFDLLGGGLFAWGFFHSRDQKVSDEQAGAGNLGKK